MFFRIDYIENINSLVGKLKIIFENNSKKEKKYPYLNNISKIKKTDNLISISTLAYSKKEAFELINKVNQEIIYKHKKLIDDYKKNINYQILNYEKELEAITNKITLYSNTIKIQTKKAINIENKNASLSAIYMLEVLKLNEKLTSLENKKFILQKNITNEKSKLLPINIKETKIVKTFAYEDHVNPKRALIVIVSFITSFILSIFIIFFIEFIRDEKEK